MPAYLIFIKAHVEGGYPKSCIFVRMRMSMPLHRLHHRGKGKECLMLEVSKIQGAWLQIGQKHKNIKQKRSGFVPVFSVPAIPVVSISAILRFT